MKLSKNAKARIKRMSQAEVKTIMKAAKLLADNDIISSGKCDCIMRTLGYNRRV